MEGVAGERHSRQLPGFVGPHRLGYQEYAAQPAAALHAAWQPDWLMFAPASVWLCAQNWSVEHFHASPAGDAAQLSSAAAPTRAPAPRMTAGVGRGVGGW